MLSDQPKHKRLFWFVCERGQVDLCVSDPGGETDLFREASLPDLIHIYRGNVPLGAAIEDGRLKVDGAPKTIRQLGGWFNFETMART